MRVVWFLVCFLCVLMRTCHVKHGFEVAQAVVVVVLLRQLLHHQRVQGDCGRGVCVYVCVGVSVRVCGC
jgi:hypothetical protein